MKTLHYLSLLVAFSFTSVASADIIISEYLLGPSSAQSAIELYNTDDTEFEFAQNDKLIRDNTGKYVSLSGQVIAAQDTLVIVNGVSTLPDMLDNTVSVFVSPKLQLKPNEYWSLEVSGTIVDTVGSISTRGDYRRILSEAPSTTFSVSHWQYFAPEVFSHLGVIGENTSKDANDSNDSNGGIDDNDGKDNNDNSDNQGNTSDTSQGNTNSDSGNNTQDDESNDCDLVGVGETIEDTLYLYVNAEASSCGNGSQQYPFLTLQKAQQAIKQYKQQNNTQTPIVVEVADGVYALKSSLIFNSNDSGSAQFPITYKAENAGKAVISAAIDVTSLLEDATSNTFTDRLVDQTVIASLKRVDLSQLDIPSSVFQAANTHGFALTKGRRYGPLMVYQEQQRMRLSRWPNPEQKLATYLSPLSPNDYPGNVSYSRVIDRGYQSGFANDDKYTKKFSSEFNDGGGTFEVAYQDRISQWHSPSDIYIDGVVGRAWEWTYNRIKKIEGNKVTLVRGEISGVYSKKPAHFYFDNVAEELDEPGEFYFDRQEKQLYLLPDSRFSNQIKVAVVTFPILELTGTSHVTFDGFVIEGSRGAGVVANNTEFVTFKNNHIRHVTMNALSIDGENNLVEGNRIYSIGGIGIALNGGQYTTVSNDNINAKTTVKANNLVTDNVIHNFAWDQKSQIPGISLRGFGHTATLNEIYDAPHFAILIRESAENTVENNYIHDLPNYFKQDGGAIYFGIGTRPHYRGNKIIGNYLKDVPTNGVYVDNFSSGALIKNNIFNNVGNKKVNFGAIDINGGGQNTMESNVIYNAERPIRYNRFAERSLFANYYDDMMSVHSAFNSYGVANTEHVNYPDFLKFLDYSQESDFKLQISSALNNLSYNDKVSFDSSVVNTNGVVMPEDNRWVNQGNVIIENNSPQANTFMTTFSGLFSATSDNWRGILQTQVAKLTDDITRINGSQSNSDSTTDSNGNETNDDSNDSNDSNQAPIAADDSAVTANNQSVLIDVLANDSDPEGGELTVTAVETTQGSAVIEGSALRYTPPTGYTGVVLITYRVENGNEASASATVSVSVTAVQNTTNDTIENEVSPSSSGGSIGYFSLLLVTVLFYRRRQ